jgi:hypothetical protein
MLLIEERKLDEALAAVDDYYTAQDEKLFRLIALGWRAKVCVLLRMRDRAAAALGDAERLIATLAHVPPFHRSSYVLGWLLYDLTALEEAVVEGRHGGRRSLDRRARRSARAAVKNAARVASERTETYKLAGRLDWLSGKTSRALRWWARSIAEGERLGARPELARAYAEVGQRLSSSEGQHLTLNGLDAAAYLDKAGRLFSDMGLIRDLEEMGVMQTSPAVSSAEPRRVLRI